MPNTSMLKESFFAASFGFRDSIVVNDQLQLAGHPHAFRVQLDPTNAAKYKYLLAAPTDLDVEAAEADRDAERKPTMLLVK